MIQLKQALHNALTHGRWLLLAATLGTISCDSAAERVPPGNILQPASPDAEAIALLFWSIFWIMLVIFFGVVGALLVAYRRFRYRPGNERGQLVHGNMRLEIAWTAGPALLLVAVFLVSLTVMCRVDAPAMETAAAAPGPLEPVRVQIIGHEWWWEIRLPELGVVTANELHLPVGRRAILELTSEDVIHSWWVPQLHGKRDLIPGRTNTLAFTPTKLGIFVGACAEFCGVQHAWMRARVVVQTEEQFQEWVLLQATDAFPPRGALAQRGAEIFFSTTCRSCHTIRGTGAVSGAGPDLTHVASRNILAAGRLENTPENMALWLARPQQVKPGNHMADLRLPEEAIIALTAYMLELR